MIEGVELIIRREGYPDRVELLDEGNTRLGRAEDNEIVISDIAVSRRHAQISISPYEVHIEDLGSGNGLYHNGHRVHLQVIAEGDEIVIEPFKLIFRLLGDNVASQSNIPTRSAARARLEVISGQGVAGSSYSIRRDGLTIGRSEKRDIVIPDPASSRHHASIVIEEGKYLLTDSSSANGLFVNETRIRTHELAPGDIIRIGDTQLRFVLYDASETELETTSRIGPVALERELTATQPSKKGMWVILFSVIGVVFFILTGFLLLVSLYLYLA